MNQFVENQAPVANTDSMLITVYNLEGEIVHKQFMKPEEADADRISQAKKFSEGMYYIIYQNRSLIRMERMVVPAY